MMLLISMILVFPLSVQCSSDDCCFQQNRWSRESSPYNNMNSNTPREKNPLHHNSTKYNIISENNFNKYYLWHNWWNEMRNVWNFRHKAFGKQFGKCFQLMMNANVNITCPNDRGTLKIYKEIEKSRKLPTHTHTIGQAGERDKNGFSAWIWMSLGEMCCCPKDHNLDLDLLSIEKKIHTREKKRYNPNRHGMDDISIHKMLIFIIIIGPFIARLNGWNGEIWWDSDENLHTNTTYQITIEKHIS